MVTDEALMRAVREGDIGQLGVLFERYRASLFDFLSRTLGDRSVAEDLVQDVFVRVLKYRQTYRDDGCFETWVFRIARNAKADYLRKRIGLERVGELTIDPPASDPGPAQLFERSRDTELLKRALMRLPEDKRELLVLARYRNMQYEQIAALLNIETGAVKVRVHRAMKELREAFQRVTDEERPCGVKTSSSTWRTI
jgi:RNA polymerase sigma-70 factor (ECF subfamily)